jgi:hypothetical protein
MDELVSTSEMSPSAQSFEEEEELDKLYLLDHQTKHFFSRRFLVICLLTSLLAYFTIPYHYPRPKCMEEPTKKFKFGQ